MTVSGLSGCAAHYYNKKTGAEHIFVFLATDDESLQRLRMASRRL